MKIEGRVTKPRGPKNKYWGVTIPLIGIHTQGKSKEDAYAMAKDAVESLVDKRGFKVTVTPTRGNGFTVESKDYLTFLAFILSRIRTNSELTTREVAKNLKSDSPNRYAMYEQGKAIPKVDTLEELLHAIDPKINIYLKAG